MIDRRTVLASTAALGLAACAATPPRRTPDQLRDEVRAAELGFAAAMAQRDLTSFGSFIADDAVFVNGGDALRGKAAVLSFWARFFKAPQAPFAWAPDMVEVLAGGDLGYTSGPVRGPDGVAFARFHSTWRREASGQWQVVFDNGTDLCAPPRVT